MNIIINVLVILIVYSDIDLDKHEINLLFES